MTQTVRLHEHTDRSYRTIEFLRAYAKLCRRFERRLDPQHGAVRRAATTPDEEEAIRALPELAD